MWVCIVSENQLFVIFHIEHGKSVGMQVASIAETQWSIYMQTKAGDNVMQL